MKRTYTRTFSIVVAVTLGISVSSSHAAEPPTLTEMNTKVLAQLQTEFNQESSKTRVILLLSPT